MNKDNIIINWLLYVVGLSLLPFFINLIICFFSDLNIYNEHVTFMGDLFFFTLILSADNLKTITSSNMNVKSKKAYNFLFFIFILLMIFSSMLYGFVAMENIQTVPTDTNTIPSGTIDTLNVQKLKIVAIINSAASFISGLVVQILKIRNEGVGSNG